MEEGGVFKGSEEELGACRKILLSPEEEVFVGIERSDITLWRQPDMISELDYWCLLLSVQVLAAVLDWRN